MFGKKGEVSREQGAGNSEQRIKNKVVIRGLAVVLSCLFREQRKGLSDEKKNAGGAV